MKKSLGALLAAGLIAGALGSVATASQGEKVTGGGQILFDTQTTGAGNTIAFTIQDDGTVKGQFQYVDRTGGHGRDQDSWHGTPVCLEVEENVAKAVISRLVENEDGEEEEELYELLLTDNGQGQDEDDLVTLTTDEEPTCGSDDDDDDNNTSLGRGNIQVTDDE